MNNENHWRCMLELNSDEQVIAGSESSLSDAIRRAADLRVYTEFYFEEHVAPDFAPPVAMDHNGLVKEVIDFRQTYLIDDRHTAGVTTTRQPMNPVLGFNGIDPRMSLFMYNMTGHQSCATLNLGKVVASDAQAGRCDIIPTPAAMPKMSQTHAFDVGSSGPSRNFVYHMEVYRFWVNDKWDEVLSHDAQGEIMSGSWDALAEAHCSGREIKVAIGGLSRDLGDGPSSELFTPLGTSFIHTAKRLYEAQTHPVVRVAPAVPMVYGSQTWDLSWIIMRTDGSASLRSLNPYTNRFRDWAGSFPCRWFVC